jgi:hypothetical protein
MDRIKLTFLDKDGAYAIPELMATGTAVFVLGRAAHDLLFANPFPYSEIGTAVGAIVVALGVAQRIRDGLWRKDETQ